MIDVFKQSEYLHGGEICKINGVEVISSVSAIVAENYKNSSKSGGCRVSFISNSPNITFNYAIKQRMEGNWPHVGITAQIGLSYNYRLLGEERRRNADCDFKRNSDNAELSVQIKWTNPDERYEFTVYLPILCYITQFTVTVPDGYDIQPIPKTDNKTLIIGSVTAYGMGITTSQFMLSNLISRKTNLETRCVAFYDWNWYKYANEIFDLLKDEFSDAKTIAFEICYNKADNSLINDKLPQLLNRLLSESIAQKIALWYKPCLRETAERWIDVVSNALSSDGSGRLKFDRSLILNSHKEHDRYLYSDNFINDYGSVEIMEYYRRMTEQ